MGDFVYSSACANPLTIDLPVNKETMLCSLMPMRVLYGYPSMAVYESDWMMKPVEQAKSISEIRRLFCWGYDGGIKRLRANCDAKAITNAMERLAKTAKVLIKRYRP